MLAREIATRLYEGRLPKGGSSGEPPQLDPFQEKAITKLADPRYGRHILGLPMGTGKTRIGVQAVRQWAPRRSLIVPTERAILSWLQEMWLSCPDMLDRYIIMGKMYRKEVREQFLTSQKKHPDLSVITNFQLLTRDRAFYPTNWDSIVLDEYHKFMRNRDTGMHKILRSMKSEKLLMVSGSPASKGAVDFFVPLNLIDSKLFGSYWKFASTWANINETPFGKQVEGTRNEEAFKRLLADYAILATKKELGLQKKRRDVSRVEMTPEQARAYAQIRDDFLLELSDKPPMLMINTLAQYIKLRKLLSCPATLAPELGIGGGAHYIMETLLDLPISERHCAIFTPFRESLPYLKAFFEGQGHLKGIPDAGIDVGVPVYTFAGGMDLEQLFERLQLVKDRGGIAICTTQYAESWDLQTADKAFMLGYDWDPQVNFQAEDRLDRMNNPHGLINIYYLQHGGTIDEDILYTLVMKQTNVNKLYSNSNALTDLLRSH